MSYKIIRKSVRYIMAHMPRLCRLIPDYYYLKLRYWAICDKKLNLQNPQTFNEKIQWLKLYDRKKEYVNMVDKAEVKNIVADKIGTEHIIPTLGVYDSVNEIIYDTLPSQFVIKCSHDSGGVFICTNKNEFKWDHVKKLINKSLKKNYFYWGREWPYKYVKPKVIIEKYMIDESGTELKDYKIFCFDGQPKIIQVDYNRFVNHKRNIYDIEWKFIDARIEYPNNKNYIIKKPAGLDKMLEYAKILSEGIPHVRVDFYSIKEEIYFGEMTFYHGSGCEKFSPDQFGKLLGDFISLKSVRK